MRRILRWLLPGVCLASCGCWPMPEPWTLRGSWQARVDQQVCQLGYRNWIVIAESSFPALSRQGLLQVDAAAEVPEVLEHVMLSLERTESVKAQVYLARELRSVPNDLAPGMDELRERLRGSLRGRETTEIDHQSLMTLLRETQRHYQILVIRTQSVLPYSTVFLELQPGYWDAEFEDRLRDRIRQERMQRLVRPVP